MVKHQHSFSREVVDIPSLEILQVKWDGALSNLI